MKKTKQASTILMILLMIVLFSACTPPWIDPDTPVGIWVSEDGSITLFFSPEYMNRSDIFAGHRFPAVLIRDGVTYQTITRHGGRGEANISLHDITSRTADGSILNTAESTLIRGTWEMAGENFVISTHEGGRIVFNKTEDYDPIDLAEWFPDSFHGDTWLPPEGVWFNNNFNIVLHIKPEFANVPVQNATVSYLAVYTTEDGNEVRMIAMFSPTMTLTLHDLTIVDEDGFIVSEDSQVFGGTWRMDIGRMIFESDQGDIHLSRHITDLYVSIDSIDLVEWFPGLSFEE